MSVNRLKLEDVANECRRCAKCDLGRMVYYGKESNMPLDEVRSPVYMLVGGSPSIDDLKDGGIFSTIASRQFEKALYATTGLMREDIYFTNVCKCCLYGTRQPVPAEIRKCIPYLMAEVEAIKPSLIISLGKTALKELANVDNLDKYHGKILFSQKYRTRVFATYSPTPKRLGKDGLSEVFQSDLDLLAKEIRGEH